MVVHLVDYFNNLAKRNKEINNIQSIIDGSEKKEKNMKDYIAELETELKKIMELKRSSEEKISNMEENIVKHNESIKLYKDDLDKLRLDDNTYIDNIIKNKVLEDMSLSQFNSVLSRYVEKKQHNYFTEIFGPHIKDHLKVVALDNDGDNIDKRQRRRKSKNRRASKNRRTSKNKKA